MKWLRWPFVNTKADEKWIGAFVDWFGSVPGFKQQMLFMLGWVVIAIVYPSIDPNMMHLMVFLTIYSGITQPMIAIQNAYASHIMMQLLRTTVHQNEALKEMIEHMAKEVKT